MVSIAIGSVKLECVTKSDLFSPKKFDDGSRLLAEHLIKQSYATALDWGCGWGALGLILAASHRQSSIICLDANIGAVTITQQNIVHNKLSNIEVLLSDSFSAVEKNMKFDLIVSHPPTHLGREIVEDMITQAKDYLSVNGELAIVVEARLKPWVARTMTDVFGVFRVISRSHKHVVLSAKRTL